MTDTFYFQKHLLALKNCKFACLMTYNQNFLTEVVMIDLTGTKMRLTDMPLFSFSYSRL